MRHLSLLIFLICADPVLAESPDCLPVEVAILSHGTPIRSGRPVTGVLEVNAGEADRNGISSGDVVVWPHFDARCALKIRR